MAGSLDWVRVSTDDGSARARGDGQPAAPLDNATFTLQEFFILGVLKDREMYGLEVARALSAHSEFGIPPGIGIIYPNLKTLVKNGLLRSRRVHGTPRIYYSLTAQGRQRLLAIARHWASLNDTVQSVVADIGAPPSA